MPTSTSLLSYSDCAEYFDLAIADPKGIALSFSYSGDARQFRLRMNAFRKLDREENAKAYAANPEHPLFGRSQYDGLMLKLREGDGVTYVIIERYEAKVREVISLSDLPEDLLLQAEEPKALPRPQEVLRLEDRRF